MNIYSSLLLLSVTAFIALLSIVDCFEFNDNYKIIDGDSYGGEGITLEPKSGKEITGTFIWIHGLRNSYKNPYNSMTSPPFGVENAFVSNDVRVIMPLAPIREVFGDNVTAWFDLPDAPQEDIEGIEESYQRLSAIVDGEVQKGINPKNIMLGGFSQGGAMAIDVLLRSKHQLRNAFSASGFVVRKGDYPASLGAYTSKPIKLYTQAKDEIVPLEAAKADQEFLSKLNPDKFNPSVQLRVFETTFFSQNAHDMSFDEVLVLIGDIVKNYYPDKVLH